MVFCMATNCEAICNQLVYLIGREIRSLTRQRLVKGEAAQLTDLIDGRLITDRQRLDPGDHTFRIVNGSAKVGSGSLEEQLSLLSLETERMFDTKRDFVTVEHALIV